MDHVGTQDDFIWPTPLASADQQGDTPPNREDLARTILVWDRVAEQAAARAAAARHQLDIQFVADDGEVVPGLIYIPGGQPRSVTVRIDPDAKAVVTQTVTDLIEALATAMGEPTGVDDGTP